MNLANEGLEARRKDEEVAAKKRKAEEDKVWEGKSSSTPLLTSLSLIDFSRKILANNV